ncbi:MAG: pyridoxal-phosphate dependent enzyme [Bacteroidetes bacterium]|nr:pyridoxal-phosphate dependent enzyme [Bacteroidota bacterium]MBS1633274.1 pyridoxal-phosphate dependent enzyme [Bacteroidota bacterium]
MQEISFQNITIDTISYPILLKKNIKASVLRLDKIHPVISGNKWFKLQFYLQEAIQLKKKTIVTFGGAWSNHIVATAAACRAYGINSIGIIRGEMPPQLSSSLRFAKESGMQLVFISRSDFRENKIPAELLHEENYFIKTGGYGDAGVRGAATILQHCEKDYYSHFCCAVGTGTMIAGLIQASHPHQQTIGISVLKNNLELRQQIMGLLQEKSNFHLFHQFHFGGYARYTTELLNFMNNFFENNQIPSDFVYTGKLFFAVMNLIKKDFFPAGSKLLLIHSGGLQGNASLQNGTLIY